MAINRSRFLILLAGVLVVVGIPLAGWWLRQDAGPRCEFDGLKIVPLYQVRVVDRADESHRFCCVRCARHWLARQGDSPAAVYVTDEAAGAEVDARSAYFVLSTVITNSVTGNRVHAFRYQGDAEGHARAYGGVVLTGAERPFSIESNPSTGGAPPRR